MVAMIQSARAETRRIGSEIRVDSRTGKLVRKTIVAPSVDANIAPLRQMIQSVAESNAVEPSLVYSVIRAESNYNPLAVSGKGAQGLMQLIPSTAKRFGVKDSFDSKDNVEGGVKYLKYLIGLFHGDYSRAIAAYNAGEAAVARYGGVPPYKETQNYVAQVSRHLDAERKAYTTHLQTAEPAASSAASPAPDSGAASTETYNPVIASVNPDGTVSYRTP